MHTMWVDLITNGYIAIVTIDPKRTYITTTTPTSQDTNLQYKEPNHTKDRMRPTTDKIQIGLRVLKITSGVHNPAQAKPEG